MTNFRIQNNANSFFQFGRLIDEHVTKTVGVTHYWDTGIVLDTLHKGVASSWDYEINVPVQGKERRNVLPGVYGLDVCLWEGGGPQCTLDHGR